MKNYIFICMLVVLASLAFADGKKELKKIVDNINSKEFLNANEHINELQEEGQQYVSQGKYEKALECYKKALVESEKLFGKNSTAGAVCYFGIGSTYLNKGEKIKAADNFIIANEIYKNSAGIFVRPQATRSSLILAGALYFQADKIPKAFEILKQAEKKINQLTPTEKVTLYSYLAGCYFSMKQYNKAKKIYQKAVALETNNSKDKMTVPLFELYDMLGLTYLKLKKYDKSRLYYYKLLSFSRKKHGEKSDYTASNYIVIAHSYYYEGKYEKAAEYFQKGVKITKELGDKKSILSTVYIDLAHTFNKLKNKKLTLKYLRTAHEILKKSPSPNLELINSLEEKIKKLNM